MGYWGYEGYNKTTQHISMILDLDPNFCTRHIKEYIDFIRIPSGTSDLFKSYKKGEYNKWRF